MNIGGGATERSRGSGHVLLSFVLADFVKVHLDKDLKQRGVVVNREVEIHRPAGASVGERTDAHSPRWRR